jgi:hypothetical protein
MGDLQMNTARGLLVEWLVAQALGDPSAFRVEWGPYDVRAADGTKVEIKATGLLQGWAMKKHSTPVWTFPAVGANSVWAEDLGEYVPVDPHTRVHVWIFALHTTTAQERYDPLDVKPWEFRVMGAPSPARHRPKERAALNARREVGSAARRVCATR